MAYTKGQWQYKDGFTGGIFGPDGELLAGGDSHEGWLELNDDVRLMMCSPDLLEALQMCTKWIDYLRASGDAGFWNWHEESEYNKAIAVISKATGK